MKREILFAAKRVDDGKWVYGFHTKDVAGHFIIEDDNKVWNIVDPKTVSQYTGLSDRRGVKIFENDVLQSTENEDAYGVVGWNPRGFWCIVASRYYVLDPEIPLGSNARIETGKTMLPNCTVAGNIWNDDIREDIFDLLKYSGKE